MKDTKLDAAWVHLGFRLTLRRPPENDAVVAHYLGLGLTPAAFLAVLMESDEFMERQRRLLTRGDLAGDAPAAAPGTARARALLFGAFGNGNVGDAAQVEAVASLLRDMAPPQPDSATPALSFAACSWERLAAYPAPGMTILRPDALMRPEHIRPRSSPGDGGGADLVVIGGGGLFGAPHFPLHEKRWAEWFIARRVPFALLGIGGSAEALATPGWHEAYRLLLERAVFVGVRDQETLAACRAIRPDAKWFPDPVLAHAVLNPVAHAPLEQRDLDAVLIPRAPNGVADQLALNGLLDLARAARRSGSAVRIAALEPATDRPALSGEDVQFIATWDELLTLCRRARMVVSARLHGVIAGLTCGCTVHGLAQPKTADLMASLGISAWFHPTGWPEPPPDLSAAAAEQFQTIAAPGLMRFRTSVDDAVAAASLCIRPALAGAPPPATARRQSGG